MTSQQPFTTSADDAFKKALRDFEIELSEKINDHQQGVPTFFDNYLLTLLKCFEDPPIENQRDERSEEMRRHLGQLDTHVLWLKTYVERKRQGRLISFSDRAEFDLRNSISLENEPYGIMIQGGRRPLHWRGRPLFKTVHDFALYQMIIWDRRPHTIIEIGSGNGASAIWMADLVRSFGIKCDIYSLDINNVDATYEAVTFLRADCMRISDSLGDSTLLKLPHPWIVIEDAHVNVGGVLRFFHQYLVKGDYVIIEDSGGKQEIIADFLADLPGCYAVDSEYTDYFGWNATSAFNSILARLSEE